MSQEQPHLWLRDETKPMEHRSAFTPYTASELINNGFKVTIERSSPGARIFSDEEFAAVEGIEFAPSGSWRTAPRDAYITGLKELPENDDSPLTNTHIQFAHCYKNQGGWQDVLSRFPRGGGTLLDLEFLSDENGRRVAAFGYHAGFGGSALALEVWAWQISNPGKPFPGVQPYPNQDLLIQHVKEKVQEASTKIGRLPRVLVIGALGRCGRGAVDFVEFSGIKDILKWDMAETAKGGPFKEIAEADIFINCIYLSKPIPKFATVESLQIESRKLSVVCDVSCDTTNPHNPIPIYNVNTTFDQPTVPVEGFSDPPLSVISIDHIPSYLPRESSEAFSRDLLPSLLQLKDRSNARVWVEADKLFHEKVASLDT